MPDNSNDSRSPVLRSAWKRHAELDENASKTNKRHMQLRRAITVLGILATLLAITTDTYANADPPVMAKWASKAMQVTLISVPIIISLLSAFSNKFYSGGEWLSLRAGAEEIKKEIYLYRTVLRNSPDRDKWLTRRLTTILRRVYKSMGGQLVIDPYEGKLPPYYHPDDPKSDPGFHDLTGEEYLKYRLVDQRDWHRKRITERERERQRTQFTILAMGGLGALLAALGGPWVTWVALTASIASSLTGWEELRSLDKTIQIYSRAILELTIIRDEWESIAPGARREVDFQNMVRRAENILWGQNQQFVSTMQEAMAASEGDDSQLVDEMINMGNKMSKDLRNKMTEESLEVMELTTERLTVVTGHAGDTVREMITDVSDETIAITSAAGESVDTLVAEVTETREMVSETVDSVAGEAAAYREAAEKVVDSSLELSGETREAFAEEAEAYQETAYAVVDTALDESAAVRETIEEGADSLAEESAAVRETISETVGTAVDKSSEMRETVGETADAFAAESDAIQEAISENAEALLDESAAMRETVGETVDTLAEESADLRESLDAASEGMEDGGLADDLRAAAGNMGSGLVEAVSEEAKQHMDHLQELAKEVLDENPPEDAGGVG